MKIIALKNSVLREILPSALGEAAASPVTKMQTVLHFELEPKRSTPRGEIMRMRTIHMLCNYEEIMKFVYIFIVAAVATVHIYIGWETKTSPLDFNLILLLLIPFLTFVWKDASVIKFGSKGLELEKLKSDVNKTIKHVAHGDSVDHKSINNLYKSVESNDWLKLVLSRMLMRKGLVALVPDHGLGVSPSLNKLIPMCESLGKITESEVAELERLRNITFYAEWWDGEVPTHEDWKWALETGQAVVQKLFDKQPIA